MPLQRNTPSVRARPPTSIAPSALDSPRRRTTGPIPAAGTPPTKRRQRGRHAWIPISAWFRSTLWTVLNNSISVIVLGTPDPPELSWSRLVRWLVRVLRVSAVSAHRSRSLRSVSAVGFVFLVRDPLAKNEWSPHSLPHVGSPEDRAKTEDLRPRHIVQIS